MAKRIETVRTQWRMGHAEFVHHHLTKRRHRDQMPKDIADVAVEARVDGGRWVVDCPFCPGAELLDPDDLRFFCLGCYNEGAEGRWLQVIVPAEKEEIETVLMERPEIWRRWDPKKTLMDLQVENVLHAHW